MLASSIAGALSGATVAAIFRGPSNVIPGVIVFSAFGAIGQVTYNAAQQPRATESSENTELNLLQRIGQSRFVPFTVLSDEEYEATLKEKLVRIEAQVALLDDDIKRLEAQEPE